MSALSGIRFRAWDTDEKRWFPKNHHEEWINISSTGEVIYGYEDGDPEMGEGRFEITQSTGLKDKNGKEIFEGDIVRASIYADEEGTNHEVKWDKQGCFCIDYRDGESDGFIIGFFPGIMEVIGNIYETPDIERS